MWIQKDEHKQHCRYCKSLNERYPIISAWRAPVDEPCHVIRDARADYDGNRVCGIDCVNEHNNTGLFAMSDGIVRYIHDYDEEHRDPKGYWQLGKFAVVEHTAGGIPVWVRYCHCESIDVKAGQEVYAGDKIGTYGHTGICRPKGPDGAHVHIDVWVAKENLDTARLLGFVRMPDMHYYRP